MADRIADEALVVREGLCTPRVLVDFNSADVKGRLYLACQGTQRDLVRQGIKLEDGLSLNLYQEDADEHGLPQELEVGGVVEYSNEEQIWVAKIDWDAIRSLPKSRVESANGPVTPRPPAPARPRSV